jgi:hypothetical protein
LNKSESGKTGELNSSRSRIGRMSTPRAASANASATTTPLACPTLKESSSGKKSIVGTPELSSRPKSALLSSTPRSRPSSTLYQHTASSAQKGILGNSPTTLNLSKDIPNTNNSTPKSSRASTRPRTSGEKVSKLFA